MLYLLIIFILFIIAVHYDGTANSYTVTRSRGAMPMILLLVLLVGLSKGIGGDVTNTYWPEFIKSPSLGILTWNYIMNPMDYEGTSRYNPLYIVTRAFFRTITDKFWVYHIFHALFINLVIYNFLRKRTSYLCLSLIFYMLINFLEYNTEIVRESLAIACSLIAFGRYEDKKYAWSLFWVLAAYLFHSSAIIAVLMPIATFLDRIPRKLVMSFFVVFAFAIPFVYEKLEFLNYIDYLSDNQANLAEYYLEKEGSAGANGNFYILFYTKFLCVPFMLMVLNAKINRFKYLGFVYFYLSGGCLAKQYAPKHKAFYYLFFISIFFVFQLYNMMGGDNAGLGPHLYNRYFPYKSVLF